MILIEFYYELKLLVQYFFLGLVQGFTEPIPISSSGHIIILKELFTLETSGLSLEIFVHFGSLLAITYSYRQDLTRLTINGLKYVKTKNKTAKADYHFMLLLIIATFITGAFGLAFESIVSDKLSTTYVVGITLFLTGIALWTIRHLHGSKSDNKLTVKDAVIIGLAQSIALVPGISRSGATIVAAMLLGIKRETALRFSFLLFIPIGLSSTLLSTYNLINDPNLNTLFIPYFIAFITAAIATFYSLKWFINIMTKGKLIYFSLYCFFTGTLVLFFL